MRFNESISGSTILKELEKPELAVPAQNGRALSSATIRGDVTASPFPIPMIDGAMLLAQEIISGENDHGPESTRALRADRIFQDWRDQADGFYE
jgi:hypothetical protein